MLSRSAWKYGEMQILPTQYPTRKIHLITPRFWRLPWAWGDVGVSWAGVNWKVPVLAMSATSS